MTAEPSPTRVIEGMVVTVHYSMKNAGGDLIYQSDDGDPLVYLHGAGNILPGLEEGLEGRTLDERFDLVVPPEKGFGIPDPARVEEIERENFPPDTEIEVGMRFGAHDSEGQVVSVWVTAVEGDRITINGNHPLAGETLSYQMHVAEIRPATDEEKSHGHVHGPGGHSH